MFIGAPAFLTITYLWAFHRIYGKCSRKQNNPEFNIFLTNFLTQWNVEYSRNRSGLKYFRPNLVTILLIQVSLGMIQEYQYIDCHQSPANTWKLKITIHQNLTAIFAVTHQLVIKDIGRYELLDICWTSFLILWWRFLFEHRRLKWPTQVYY